VNRVGTVEGDDRGDTAGALTLGAARDNHVNQHGSRDQVKRLCETETVRRDEIEYLERPQGGPAWLAEDHLENVG